MDNGWFSVFVFVSSRELRAERSHRRQPKPSPSGRSQELSSPLFTVSHFCGKIATHTHTHIYSHRKPHISLLSLLWTYTTLPQTHTRTFSLALSLSLSLFVCPLWVTWCVGGCRGLHTVADKNTAQLLMALKACNILITIIAFDKKLISIVVQECQSTVKRANVLRSKTTNIKNFCTL